MSCKYEIELGIDELYIKNVEVRRVVIFKCTEFIIIII